MSRQPGAYSGENSEFYRRSLTYKEKSFLPNTRVGQMFCLAIAAVICRLPSCVDSKQQRWAPVLLSKVRFPRQGACMCAVNAERTWMHQDGQGTCRESEKLQVWSVHGWFNSAAVSLLCPG